jgi:hypothetical protein
MLRGVEIIYEGCPSVWALEQIISTPASQYQGRTSGTEMSVNYADLAYITFKMDKRKPA